MPTAGFWIQDFVISGSRRDYDKVYSPQRQCKYNTIHIQNIQRILVLENKNTRNKKKLQKNEKNDMVGVEEEREFRFRVDLYSQESTFPLVIIIFNTQVV